MPQPFEHDAARRALESMATGFLALDRSWTVTYLNAEAERIGGWSRETLVGRNFWQEFPIAESLDFGREYRRAMDTGETVSFEAFAPGADGWFEIRAVPSAEGLGIHFVDVTARRLALHRAELTAKGASLLGEVSRELSSTLDGQEAVSRLASMTTPALADWCVITVVDDGVASNLGYSHRDAARIADVAAYAEAQLGAVTDRSTIWQVLRTGEPVQSETIAPELLAEVFPDPGTRELLTRLDPTSGLAVPLTARGVPLGVLSLWNTGDRSPHSPEEMELAVEIGLRAGLALDNTRLFSRHRRFSEALQHSMLTEPPEPDHCEITVRYVPAAHEVQVGGDWYDAFLTPSGATVLVIGDVVGHDTSAAAAMGQVRGLLRGIAYTTGDGPAALLTRVDEALQGLMLDTLATAIAARLEQREPDRPSGTTWLRWSNAGHPPIMLITPEHQVAALVDDAGLMLGVDPGQVRRETVTQLRRGSTIVMYTDGLVERRGVHLDDGLRLLRETLAELAGLPLEDLVDELLARMLTDTNEDDVALLAVRLHHQNRARPPEAGPEVLPSNLT